MKKSLMLLLILCSCVAPQKRDDFTPTFRILQNERGENMACINSEDTQKLWKVLNQCQGGSQ
jgi:hypothetical protein